MSRRTIRLYEVTIKLRTFKEEAEGLSEERLAEFRREWEADAHRTIILQPALYEPDWIDHRYTPHELHTAYRWSASVIARLLIAHAELIAGTRKRHGCGSYDEACGVWYQEGFAFTWSGPHHDTPYAHVKVPTDTATRWRDHLRHGLIKLLADDQSPLEPSDHPRTPAPTTSTRKEATP